jgi:hypothetical protein
LKIYLFWGGMVCNIGTFLIVLYYLLKLPTPMWCVEP